MLSVKMEQEPVVLLNAFFRLEVDSDRCEHASSWTLLLEENRNHVWSDLSRLVDVECKNGL